MPALPYEPIEGDSVINVPAPVSSPPDLPSEPFPVLSRIAVTDLVGPSAANRQHKVLEKRTNSLQAAIDRIADVLADIDKVYVRRDGTSQKTAGAGILGDMQFNSFKVTELADGTLDAASQDSVNGRQVYALKVQIDSLLHPLGQAVYTTPGAFTWTKPVGARRVRVFLCSGAGGGGGGTGGIYDDGTAGGGGGGGSAGSTLCIDLDISAVSSLGLVIGAGGAGGAGGAHRDDSSPLNGSVGGTGAPSSVTNGAATYSTGAAAGGAGGLSQSGSAGGGAGQWSSGGAGGDASAVTTHGSPGVTARGYAAPLVGAVGTGGVSGASTAGGGGGGAHGVLLSNGPVPLSAILALGFVVGNGGIGGNVNGNGVQVGGAGGISAGGGGGGGHHRFVFPDDDPATVPVPPGGVGGSGYILLVWG